MSNPLYLVALHGFTGRGSDFDALLSRGLAGLISFAPLTPCSLVTLDLPGHDGGLMVSPEDGLQEAFQKITGTVNTFGECDDFILMGYSMGARIALHYALAYPEKVKRLILIGGSPGIDESLERIERLNNDYLLSKKMMQMDLKSFLEAWAEHPLIQSQKNILEPLKSIIQMERLKHSIEGLSQSLLAYSPGKLESLWPLLKTIKCPVDWIVGEKDVKYVAIAQKAQSMMPKAGLHVMPAVGHAAHLEAPNLFIKCLERIINQ
jgi:2-succinyl-6-hydroxy-2,4-cyclohexadiene-1-carboxylate synthase